jgi:hypothetical protein
MPSTAFPWVTCGGCYLATEDIYYLPESLLSVLATGAKALATSANQPVKPGRNPFTEVRDPECRGDARKNVHGVMRAQD